MHHTLFEERASIFIGLNAIIQFVGDVILEGLGLIPPRINHLALTFLNAFISFKTLSAIHKDKFRFLHEDCQVFWLLELLLIIGDVYYSFYDDWGREFILLRLTFVLCSTFNWLFITWIIIKYKLYHITYQGSHDAENESFIHGDENTSDKENSKSKELHRDAIEIMNMNTKISYSSKGGSDGYVVPNKPSPKETDQLKKDISPKPVLKAEIILVEENENMNDYHIDVDNTCTESVEDSLSNRNKLDDNEDHQNVSPLHPHQVSCTLTPSEVP